MSITDDYAMSYLTQETDWWKENKQNRSQEKAVYNL
jgi:hypothetical protein